MSVVSRDIDNDLGLACTDEITRTALELQWTYFEYAERYVASTDLSPAYKHVISEWRGLLEDLGSGWKNVADRLDWAAKLNVLEGYRERDGLEWKDPKLRLVDLQFHDVDPDRGLYQRLLRGGRIRRLFNETEVTDAMERPPDHTRAYFRGESLRRFGPAVVAANWDSLVFDVGEASLVRLPMMEPRRGTRDLVEELLDTSPDAATLLEQIGATDE